jgi:gamma-glutamylcyclotransferase (GGCT)/AIG2-like uncharacterized protein YtfP
MFNEVLSRLLKGEYRKINSSLKGYQRVHIVGEIFPGIKLSSDRSVDGLLVFGLNDKDIKILDDFEADYYRRKQLFVVADDGQEYAADVYVFREKYYYKLTGTDWSPEEFKEKYLAQFLSLL